jgi:hypothetical protein
MRVSDQEEMRKACWEVRCVALAMGVSMGYTLWDV